MTDDGPMLRDIFQKKVPLANGKGHADCVEAAPQGQQRPEQEPGQAPGNVQKEMFDA